MSMPWPNFYWEKKFNRKGFLIFGVDEVGRGALAGPVVAAAVSFGVINKGLIVSKKIVGGGRKIEDLEHFLQEKGVNDSKKLNANKREELSIMIKKVSLTFGIGKVSASAIDKKGIVNATQKAMRLAVLSAIRKAKAREQPFLLIDAFHVKYLAGVGLRNQKPIIKGDEKSLSIAAASIIAKVYRDKLMVRLARKFPFYTNFGWQTNKGYGTKTHREAIIHFGKTRYHRKSFLNWLKS